MVSNPLSSVVKSDDGEGRHMGHNLVHHINAPSRTENQGPTDSHAISQAVPDEQGLVQKAGASQEVSDIGWEHGPGEIGEQIVPGLANDDLWMLLRRSNCTMSKLCRIRQCRDSTLFEPRTRIPPLISCGRRLNDFIQLWL